MNKLPKYLLKAITVILALFSLASQATELQSYVQQCQNELHFNASDVKPMNCNNGVRFAFGGQNPVNDFLVYQSINDTVDLVAACRWLGSIANSTDIGVVSIELLIHNRQNGETCFFSANDSPSGVTYTGDPNRPVRTAIVSPTNFSTIHGKNNPNADDFWLSPNAVDSKILDSDSSVPGSNSARCVGCHAQGPYIASERIAPHLAQFGLLNDRHDTFAKMNSGTWHYHAVGSNSGPPYNNLPTIPAFFKWDSFIASNDINNDSFCSGCHAFAQSSIIGNLFPVGNAAASLLPSIQQDINDLEFDQKMPPSDDQSDYRWINLDTPNNNTPGTGVETENFADAMSATNTLVPTLLNNCPAPGKLEAHAVGVDGNFSFSTSEISQLPDRLRTFNLKDGLVCLNSDQEAGQKCHDYAIRYLCSVNTDRTPNWSTWYAHVPAGDGDHEERYRDSNICGGAVTPIAIQTEVSVNGVPVDIMGPNDRLARLSPYGLNCNNIDQSDGKCSNYVVRFSSCGTPPPPSVIRLLTNENTTAGSKQLTAASSSLVKGQAHNNSWNTQQWAVESIANTEYVRLRNTGTNVYLNVASTAEQATVGTAGFSNTATGEMWTIEPVSNSADFRLKNLLSGKYLTMADPNSFPSTPDYLPIYSQGLNTGWNTQRWIIN